MLFRRRPPPPPETIADWLARAAPAAWLALPADIQQPAARLAVPAPATLRSPRHALWAAADQLQTAAAASRRSAEACALAALAAPGDDIDVMLAYTILIRLYEERRHPDEIERCRELCHQAIDRTAAFQAAWRARAAPRILSAAELPRLPAYDWLMAYYRQQGDVAAAAAIGRQAAAAGYPEYLARLPAPPRTPWPTIAAFAGGLLAMGATTAALEVHLIYAADADYTPFYLLLTLLLWGFTLLLAFAGPLRDHLLSVPRWLRRHPALLWLILLLVGLAVPVRAELLRFNTLFQRYDTWMLLWGTALLCAAGLTAADRGEMARRLGRSPFAGLLVTLTTCALLLVGGELYLRYGPAFSNSYAIGLIHTRWTDLYWHPENAAGFRDVEPACDVPPEVQRVLVAGDSFVAGLGINNYENTFPRVLARHLGERYRVNIAAMPGWNTRSTLSAVLNYPCLPDILIWSYFVNDIAEIDGAYIQPLNALFAEPEEPVKTYVETFYLAELAYWNLYRQLVAGLDGRYSSQVLSAYADPAVWAQHELDLQSIVSLAAERRLRLVVIVFPALNQMSASEPAVRQVENFFSERGVPVVSMLDDLRGRSPGQLVVNPFDMHPNEDTHRRAAEALLRVLQTP
ncbi:MAG: SGNH/GDSL hydrolase family protein [Anaerolineae bacterium]|jgi:hypothetical protein|nr:SGNH/GDSL hydrolase family protein [Anaerolineae bacterium]